LERLDDIDYKILEELKRNAKAHYREIAEKLGLSITLVFKRIKKLEQAKVIKRYTIVTDDDKLGKSLTAFVGINVRPSDADKVIEELSKMHEVTELFKVTGDFDLLAKIKVSSTDELWHFLYVKTTKIKEILKTTTMLAVKAVKEEL